MGVRVCRDGKKTGELTLEQFQAAVARGQVRQDDLIWQDGWPDWKPYSEVADQFATPPKAQATPETQEPIKSIKTARGGKETGDWTREELQHAVMSGEVRQDDFVWQKGWNAWKALSDAAGELGLALPANEEPRMPAKFGIKTWTAASLLGVIVAAYLLSSDRNIEQSSIAPQSHNQVDGQKSKTPSPQHQTEAQSPSKKVEPKDELTLIVEMAEKHTTSDGICLNLYNGIRTAYNSAMPKNQKTMMMRMYLGQMKDQYCFVEQSTLSSIYKKAQEGSRNGGICLGQFQMIERFYKSQQLPMRHKIEMIGKSFDLMDRYGCF